MVGKESRCEGFLTGGMGMNGPSSLHLRRNGRFVLVGLMIGSIVAGAVAASWSDNRAARAEGPQE